MLDASEVTSLTSHFWGEAAGVFKAKLAKVWQDRSFRARAGSECPKTLASLAQAVEKLGRGAVSYRVALGGHEEAHEDLDYGPEMSSYGVDIELNNWKMP